jgi:hypothetical protein
MPTLTIRRLAALPLDPDPETSVTSPQRHRRSADAKPSHGETADHADERRSHRTSHHRIVASSQPRRHEDTKTSHAKPSQGHRIRASVMAPGLFRLSEVVGAGLIPAPASPRSSTWIPLHRCPGMRWKPHKPSTVRWGGDQPLPYGHTPPSAPRFRQPHRALLFSVIPTERSEWRDPLRVRRSLLLPSSRRNEERLTHPRGIPRLGRRTPSLGMTEHVTPSRLRVCDICDGAICDDPVSSCLGVCDVRDGATCDDSMM